MTDGVIYFCGLDNENKIDASWAEFVDITNEAKVGCAGQDSTLPPLQMLMAMAIWIYW